MTKSRVVALIEVEISPVAADRTILVYAAMITTKGRLAIIGDMVMRATAGVVIDQVTRCLRTRLEAVPQ